MKIISRHEERDQHQLRLDLRGTVVEGENITLVRWVITSGAEKTGLHSHAIHEQFTIIIEGSVETRVGADLLVLAAGDICRIRPGIMHGHTRALGGVNATLIDVFEPRREEYVAAALERQNA